MLNDHLNDIPAEHMKTALRVVELHEQFSRETDPSSMQQAGEWVDEELRLAEEIGWSVGMAYAHRDMARYLARLTEFDQAISHLNSALALGYVEYKLGRYEISIELHKQALAIADEIDAPLPRSVAHFQLYEVMKDAGDIATALEHFEEHYRLRGDIFTEDSDKRLQEVRVRYELDKAQSLAEIEHLQAEQLQYQLDAKQHELTATAMSLARQSELLGRFRNDLRQIMHESSEPLQMVRQFREKLKELPCESIDWTKFEVEFQETYPGFRAKLVEKYPMLTKTEMRICSLIKAQLLSYDIAQLLCMSERTVETHRLNIRRKMELSRGEDLYDMLSEL